MQENNEKQQDELEATRSSQGQPGSQAHSRNPEAATGQQHKQRAAGIWKQPEASQKHLGSRLDGQASTLPFKI